ITGLRVALEPGLDVGPGAEHLAGARQNRRPDVVPVAERVEHAGQLVEEPGIHRVHGRPVHRHQRHVLVHLARDELVRVHGWPSLAKPGVPASARSLARVVPGASSNRSWEPVRDCHVTLLGSASGRSAVVRRRSRRNRLHWEAQRGPWRPPSTNYPFSVPKVNPLTRCRCITPMKITIGARMPTAPAADQDQYSIFSAPYWAMATDSGLAVFPVRIRQ